MNALSLKEKEALIRIFLGFLRVWGWAVPDFLANFLMLAALGGTGFLIRSGFLPKKSSPCTRRARSTQDAVIDFSAKSQTLTSRWVYIYEEWSPPYAQRSLSYYLIFLFVFSYRCLQGK